MAYKMKGSPAKMGTIQGTAGHSSALKMRAEENASALKQRKKEYKKSPKEKVDTQREYQAKLKELENRKKEGKRERNKYGSSNSRLEKRC